MKRDLRPLLKRLETESNRAAVWSDVIDAVYHQGDIGDSAFAIIPHIVRIHETRGDAEWDTYALAVAVELVRAERGNPDAPPWAAEAYREALKSLAKRGLSELPLAKSPEAVRSILALLAAVYGARTYARVLADYTEDEVAELEATLWGSSPSSHAG